MLPSVRTDTLVAAGIDRFVVEVTRESTHGDTELLGMCSAENLDRVSILPWCNSEKLSQLSTPHILCV